MNFALILFLLTVATGAIWLLDRLVLARRRAPDAPVPAWIEYPVSFFPVLLVVFLLGVVVHADPLHAARRRGTGTMRSSPPAPQVPAHCSVYAGLFA